MTRANVCFRFPLVPRRGQTGVRGTWPQEAHGAVHGARGLESILGWGRELDRNGGTGQLRAAEVLAWMENGATSQDTEAKERTDGSRSGKK